MNSVYANRIHRGLDGALKQRDGGGISHETAIDYSWFAIAEYSKVAISNMSVVRQWTMKINASVGDESSAITSTRVY